MKEHIRNKEVARCEICGGLVKPGIVLSVRPVINFMASKLTSLGSHRRVHACYPIDWNGRPSHHRPTQSLLFYHTVHTNSRQVSGSSELDLLKQAREISLFLTG